MGLGERGGVVAPELARRCGARETRYGQSGQNENQQSGIAARDGKQHKHRCEGRQDRGIRLEVAAQ